MKTVVITGITGTLGSALGQYYKEKGWRVIGVSRKESVDGDYYSEFHTNPQRNADDAQALLEYNPDLIILNAGQIETDIGVGGIPLQDQYESITTVNYIFPAIVALEAAVRAWNHSIDIIAIGSIADGSPSCFGPIYHASKIAMHYFVSGVGPIVAYANPRVRLRLYRPGAIRGPLAWAPVNRLNEKGYIIRAKRVNNAPKADVVAVKIAKWIDGKDWIGTYEEPFSFKVFKYLYALFPNSFYKLQMFGWRKGSKFV